MKFITDGKEDTRKYKPWLQGMIDYLKQNYKEPVTLIISPAYKRASAKFVIENRLAKVFAYVEKDKAKISIKITKQLEPNPDLYLIPPTVEVLSLQSLETEDFTELFSEQLIKHICQAPKYSDTLPTERRVKVTQSPSEITNIYGGLISDVYDVGDYTIVVLDNGIQYKLCKKQCADKVIKPYQFLVMRDDKEFEALSRVEFERYFQIA